MATYSTKGVAGIPLAALDAIQDENTRQVLVALVDGWHVRNGSTGTGDSRFVTKAELAQQAFKTDLLVSSGGTSSGGGSADGGGTVKPGQIAQIINDVQASVFASQLWSDLGSRISLIQIDNTQNAADIKTETQKRINADNAIVQTTTTQFAVLNGNVAAVQQQVTTIANNVSSYSQLLTTLQSQVGANTSALQIEANTRATADNELSAKFSVKIDQNGYVSGFGLMSTANNSTPYSRFIVRADQFAIGSPSGPGITPAVPFVVQTTWDAKGNPPGVYMDTAYLKKASIATALIDDAAITSAKIQNAAVTYAKIGDAEVGTLKIQGNAVTIPSSATSIGYGPWAAVYLPQPGNVVCIGQAVISGTSSADGGGSFYGSIRVSCYSNPGPVLYGTGPTATGSGYGSAGTQATIMTMAVFSLPAGYYSFNLQVDTSMANLGLCQILALGTMR